MSLAWIAAQIQAAREAGAFEPPPLVAFNPRPPGVAIEGSATTAVLDFMRQHPRRFFTHHEILRAVGRSRVSVDWALIRLRSWGLVESVPDAGRNSRYLRYRIVNKKVED